MRIDRIWTTTDSVASDIAEERLSQLERWSVQHDDTLSINDWVTLITDYAGFSRALALRGDRSEARKRLVQAGALTVAAIEAIDRALAPEE